MSQELEIIRAIKEFGYVDRKMGINELGIWNLTAVISKMRQKGYDIVSIEHKGVNRYGRKVKWCSYKLGEE